jgi:hypothetical protein
MNTPSRRFWLCAAVACLVAPTSVPAQPGRYGPYATARRAQEVANQFQAKGWRAAPFHNGDGWYVDVRR